MAGLDSIRERNKDGKLDKFIKATSKTTVGKKGNFQDDTIFYPKLDNAGNAIAILRFLPGLESEDEPIYVEQITHGFKGLNGKFFFDYCGTKYDKGCAVCDSNRKIVDTHGGDFDALPDAPKKLVRNRSRKITFYANVLVLENPSDPTQVGKVMKFRFGKKILEKIMSKVDPQFETDPVTLVWEYLEGCNFKLIIKKVKGFVNYDDSFFEAVTPLADDVIEKCRKEQHVLNGYLDPKLYKDYMMVRNRLGAFIGNDNLADIPDEIKAGNVGGTFNPGDDAQKDDGAPKGKAENPLTQAKPDPQPNAQPEDSSSNALPGTGGNPMSDVGSDDNVSEADADGGASSEDMDYFRNLATGDPK